VRLFEKYKELASKPSDHIYIAAKIGELNNVYIAARQTGQPSLLAETDTKSFEPSLRTARVSLTPSQELIVTDENSVHRNGFFHILSCETSNKVDIEYFIILVESFLSSITKHSLTIDEMSVFFNSMNRLFTTPPAKDPESARQGLWGELFVMNQVKGFRFWFPFWHSEVKRIFDFSSVGKYVEVKTTLNTDRTHHFSHRQLYELTGEEIVIASLILRVSQDGLSLRELLNHGRSALKGSPNYIKLERAVLHAGMGDNSIDGPKYHFNQALRDMRWFRAAEVPRFSVPEPSGVTETRYKVNLSKATCLESAELENWLNTWQVNQ